MYAQADHIAMLRNIGVRYTFPDEHNFMRTDLERVKIRNLNYYLYCYAFKGVAFILTDSRPVVYKSSVTICLLFHATDAFSQFFLINQVLTIFKCSSTLLRVEELKYYMPPPPPPQRERGKQKCHIGIIWGKEDKGYRYNKLAKQ